MLLLEAGGKDDWFWIDIPVGYLYTIGNPRTDWCYKTEPDPGLNGRQLGYRARHACWAAAPRSTPWSTCAARRRTTTTGPRSATRAGRGTRCCRIFRQSEDYFAGADDIHGAGGELRVEEPRVRWEILDAWREAAAECGIPKIKEFNRGDNFGNAYFQMNQKRGRALERDQRLPAPGACTGPTSRVIDEAHAYEDPASMRKDGRSAPPASSSCAERQGECCARRARETVILAAGSIGSPQLLQLSGVGPATLLQRSTASRSCTSCPASARTCTTTCRSAWCTR